MDVAIEALENAKSKIKIELEMTGEDDGVYLESLIRSLLSIEKGLKLLKKEN